MEMTHEFRGKVVSLFASAPPVMFPAIAQVDAYWEGLRGGRAMPDRMEVDPRGLEGALEFAFMLDHIAPGVGRVRIAGMHLSDLLGMEVRGMPMTAFFEPPARTRVSDVIRKVIECPRVADLQLVSDRGIGRPPLRARLYLAPLTCGEDGPRRLLGCLQAEGRIGRTPRRFTVDQVHLRRIVAAAGSEAVTSPTLPAFAEPPAHYTRQPAAAVSHRKANPGRAHPHLRLVKSD